RTGCTSPWTSLPRISTTGTFCAPSRATRCFCMLKDRDRAILQKIVIYCQQIEQTVARFGADFETYCADHVYRNACCMCILQIGELVGKLSGELTAACPNIPWRSIR